MTTIKHQIKHRYTDAVLFEADVPADMESGLRTRAALEQAVVARANLAGANLAGANLAGANLAGANLAGANLDGANLDGANLAGANLAGANLAGANLDIKPASPEESITALDRVGAIILDDAARLNMGVWHEKDGWQDRTCAEEAVCGTAHCLAGWLQVCATDPELRKVDAQLAGTLAAPVAAKMFFRGSKEVLGWLKDRKYVAELAEQDARKAAREAAKAA